VEFNSLIDYMGNFLTGGTNCFVLGSKLEMKQQIHPTEQQNSLSMSVTVCNVNAGDRKDPRMP
jgi:hypothetical protein